MSTPDTPTPAKATTKGKCPTCGKRRGALEQGTPLPYCDDPFHTPPEATASGYDSLTPEEYDRAIEAIARTKAERAAFDAEPEAT